MPETTLAELAADIADGSPINWDRVRGVPAPHHILERARLVERVAKVQRSLPPAESFAHSLRSDATPDDAQGQAPPQTWGPLINLRKIGHGTFGDVYRALDPRLNREVALKLLRRRDRRESAVIEEGQLMARVRHPGVVTIYGAERIDGRVGLWMELVEGRTLEEELAARGPLPPAEVAAIGRDPAAALAAVHHAGLLHRDIKAQNVMRDASGRVLLTDFGAGREVSELAPAGRELAGTPLYLAPEVLDGHAASAASDVYSLGVLLFHLLTGSFPVQARSMSELREAHARPVGQDLRAIRADVPARLARCINRAIDRDPARRYASAEALRSALGTAHPPVRLLWIAALVVVISASLAAWWRATSVSDRLSFRPHDLVLIARFDNLTGDAVLDRAVEYAIERELSNSNVVGLVPGERIDDALQMMKRQLDTVVDRAVAREVALRDGHIKAILAGRVERLGTKYVLTVQLVDPTDNAVVASVSEEAAGLDSVGGALRRIANQIRVALGERRDRLTGVDRQNEPVSTRSLKAFQLYQQSYELLRRGRADTALELARQSVAEDPDFATGWIHLAWCVVRQAGVIAGSLHRPQFAAAREEIRPYLERAKALAPATVEWERNWILASYYHLSLDSTRAVPFYEAVILLRPDHAYATRNLIGILRNLGRLDQQLLAARQLADLRPNALEPNVEAARLLVVRTRSMKEAEPYLARARQLLPPDDPPPTVYTRSWIDWLPAYVAFDAGNVAETMSLVNEGIRLLPTRSPTLRKAHGYAIGGFLMALGRLREGMQFHMQSLEDGVDPQWEIVNLAYLQDDRATMRRILPAIDFRRFGPRTMLLMQAGLVDRAREVVRTVPLRASDDDALLALARGSLLLVDGRPAGAVPVLQQAVAELKPTNRFEYYAGCDSAATALKRIGRRDDAIRALEECVDERPRYNSVNFVKAAHWQRLMLRLADEYRDARRLDDARQLERRLRGLFAYAEADHPLVARLDARQ